MHIGYKMFYLYPQLLFITIFTLDKHRNAFRVLMQNVRFFYPDFNRNRNVSTDFSYLPYIKFREHSFVTLSN
jgi:hypothetical protein